MGIWGILESMCNMAHETERKALEEADRRGLPVRPDARARIEGYDNSSLKQMLERNAKKEQSGAMMRNPYRR